MTTILKLYLLAWITVWELQIAYAEAKVESWRYEVEKL